MSSPTPSLASAPTEMLTPIAMPAPINVPTPDITFDPTPIGAHMDMPTPDIAPTPINTPTQRNPTPTSAPTGIPNPSPNPNPQPGIPAPRTSTTGSTIPWGNQASLTNIWGSEDHRFTDESSHLFSLYLTYAEKRDKELTENWIAGADGILVFTGLFAAALATFVIDSYKTLLPDSGSNTVTLLTQISQQLANGSQASSLVASVPAFTPTTSAVWVNALWFLSLVISLFCALLATLQQYWARRYLRLTHPQCAIHKRARLRSFFAEGVDRFYLPFAVEAIPTLLHISMFLFLTGLVISLFSIHQTIAHIILAATIVCGFVYMVITVMPVFYHNSPYQSPLSGLTWAVPRKIAKTVLSAVYHIVSFQKHTGFIQTDTITSLSKRITACKRRLSKSMSKAAEDAAERQDWTIDARALSWTLDQSDEESELERFIAGIARFTRTKKMADPMGMLKAAISGSRLRSSLYRDVTTLLINATDAGLLRGYKELPEPLRQHRIVMCLEALFFIPQAIEKILRRVAEKLTDPKVNRAFASVLQSQQAWNMALGFSMYRIRNKQFESIVLGARCIAAVMASRLPDTMAREILEQQMRITDLDKLDRYEGSRDSFLLNNLNNFLVTAAFQYMHVETDLLVSTARIIKQGLDLNAAAEELRAEFERLFTLLRNFAFNMAVSAPLRKNARGLLFELASLRNPASGNGGGSPAAQIDSPTAMSPVSPTIQFPSPTRVLSDNAFISMLPYPSQSGVTQSLTPMPPHPAHLASPQSAPPPMMTIPSRDDSLLRFMEDVMQRSGTSVV